MTRENFDLFKQMILGKGPEIETVLNRALPLVEEDERFQFRTRVNAYRVLTRVQRGRADTWGDWDLAPPVWARVERGELYVGSDASGNWPGPSQTNLDFPTFYNVHLMNVGGPLRSFIWQYADPTEPLATSRNPLPIRDFFDKRLGEIEKDLSGGKLEEASKLAHRLNCAIYHVINVPRYIEAFRGQASDPLLYFKDLSSDNVQEIELARHAGPSAVSHR